MRLNATVFPMNMLTFKYGIRFKIIQLRTPNAGGVETEGFEVDVLWNTNVEGLTLGGAFAYADNMNTKLYCSIRRKSKRNEEL